MAVTNLNHLTGHDPGPEGMSPTARSRWLEKGAKEMCSCVGSPRTSS